jgi:aryl-alcohol dehydrogenase-like predicted oxidoreductase
VPDRQNPEKEPSVKQRRLGRSGLMVSEIGMGTMTFGSMADEAESLRILDTAFDRGVDFIDAAEMYPVPPDAKWVGRTEEICGKWLSGRPRDSVIVASKVAGPLGGWFEAPLRHGKTGLDRRNIEVACDESLRRLGTDYIDLYQTHWPDPGLPIEETLEALDRLLELGKVRAIGCSNQSCYGLTESLWKAERGGTARYETIQNNFSLLNRRFEDDLAECCRAQDVSLLPYSPLAGGVLTNKYRGGEWPEGARFSAYRAHSPRTEVMTKRFVNGRTLEATERFAVLAAECGMEPATFAVAWTLTKKWVGSTLIGATSVAQLDETLAAADVTLPADVLARVDEISREIRYPLG